MNVAIIRRVRSTVVSCALAFVVSGLLAAEPALSLRVVSLERFEKWTSAPYTYTADKDTVILVLTLSGLTTQDMKRLVLGEYERFIKSGEKRYECPTLVISNTADVNLKSNERKLVCRSPRAGGDLVLHVEDKAPVSFRVVGPIKPGRA